MLTKRSLATSVSAFSLLALLLGACQALPAALSSPIPPTPTPIHPSSTPPPPTSAPIPPTATNMPVPPTATNTPVPEATINCNPDLYASSIADVVGVWGVISGIAGKGNLEFKADGTYAIIIVQPNSAMGITAGFVMDSGNFHFEGTRLKLENASCQDAQGNLFACVGIYGACVTRQGDQPARLTLVAIDDKFTGRRQGLTPKTPFFIIQP